MAWIKRHERCGVRRVILQQFILMKLILLLRLSLDIINLLLNLMMILLVFLFLVCLESRRNRFSPSDIIFDSFGVQKICDVKWIGNNYTRFRYVYLNLFLCLQKTTSLFVMPCWKRSKYMRSIKKRFMKCVLMF